MLKTFPDLIKVYIDSRYYASLSNKSWLKSIFIDISVLTIASLLKASELDTNKYKTTELIIISIYLLLVFIRLNIIVYNHGKLFFVLWFTSA